MDKELQRARRTAQQQSAVISQLQEELCITRTFLHLLDSHTDKAMMDTVRHINYDAVQIANTLVEALADMTASRAPIHSDCTTCTTFATRFPGVLPFLQRSGRDLDDDKYGLRIEILLSALLEVCHGLMQPWSIATGNEQADAHVEAFMRDLSDSIFREELQVLSGNWRAMAYRHISRLVGSSDLSEQDVMLKSLHAFLQPIWHVYGLSVDQVASVVATEDMSEMFKSLIGQVHVYKRDAAQGVVSAELQTVMVQPGTQADTSSMDLRHGSSVADDLTVLCTTGLGLRRTAQLPSGETEVTNLLRVEVLMASSVVPSLMTRD